ncbi:MAG TPA: hypothetical protein VIK33_19805 [Anaerolineae bacterium]
MVYINLEDFSSVLICPTLGLRQVSNCSCSLSLLSNGSAPAVLAPANQLTKRINITPIHPDKMNGSK